MLNALFANEKQGGMGMIPHNISSTILSFLKERVLSITEITRTKKLTEILDSYADKEVSDEVYIIQNTRNKNAQAVISDLDYFQQLLMIKEAVDAATDEIMYNIAIQRKDDIADISFASVVQGHNLNLDRIVVLSEEIEEE